LLFPDQLSQGWPTPLTKPGSHPFRFAVPVKLPSAAAALGFPRAFRHVGVPAPLWLRTDLHALLLPYLIVPVPRTDQGVGDFVQDRVPNLRHRIFPFHEL